MVDAIPFVRRTWIEVNLDTIIHNFTEAKSLLIGGARLMCVLKSNAYGHGLLTIAKALQEAGADAFAVACAREGLSLRHAGITGEILVMGLCDEELLCAAISRDLMLTAADERGFARASSAAQQVGKPARVHIKVDTAMHRLGFAPTQASAQVIASCAKLPHIQIEGLYSHLQLISPEKDACAHEKLIQMRGYLAALSVYPPSVHLCDSIGMVRYPAWQYQYARAGAFLFGVRPMHSDDAPFACDPALRFMTRVAQIHDVSVGESVGYDERNPMARPSRIATLCAGYGDGYPRRMGDVASVSIRGHLCPVVGVVCMDQMMCDVTDYPDIAQGDDVTLLGGDIPYGLYATWAQSNRNECIATLGARPPRVYYKDGKVSWVDDALLGGGSL